MADVSIVFRNRDGTHTGKIYVNDYQAAAELASKFRNATHIVDVISIQDKIILRWDEGHPDWKHGETKPIKLATETYRFERPEDAFWDVEGRQWLLSDALCSAFDVAAGQSYKHNFEQLRDHVYDHVGEDVWPLIEEAQAKADEMAKETDNEVWGEAISDWMSDPQHLFIRYQIEHAALTMHTQELASSIRLRKLHVELATLAVHRSTGT